jgi:hypothetical protein
VTLDDSALWIVQKPVLVAENVTLKVTEGAIMQFLVIIARFDVRRISVC